MRDDTIAPEPAALRRCARLGWGFVLLVALTFALIVLGALVRAHGAGLACPDWPLCFGRVLPPMNLEVAFEWSHRALAGSVSIVFLVLALLTLRHPESRRRAGGFVVAAGGLLVLQVLLGALTVWKLLAAWTVTAHLLTGNAFAATLLLVVLRLRPRTAGEPLPASTRPLLLGLGLLLGFQLLLGGLVSSRYAGLACPEWPACNGGVWFPTLRGSVGLHLLHRTNGYLLVVALAVAATLLRRTRPGAALAAALLLGLAQIAVGVANVLLGIPVEVTGLHSALAAALVLCLTYAVHEAWLAPQALPLRQRAEGAVVAG